MAETKESKFDIELIRKLFSYNPETGIITRLIGYDRAVAGQQFDSPNISVLGVHVRTGRLA